MVPRLRSQLFVSRLDEGWWRYLLSPFFVCHRLISNVRNFPLFWLAWFSMYLHWKWFRNDGDTWYLGEYERWFLKSFREYWFGCMAYYDLSLWRWVNLQISSYGGWYQWQMTNSIFQVQLNVYRSPRTRVQVKSTVFLLALGPTILQTLVFKIPEISRGKLLINLWPWVK